MAKYSLLIVLLSCSATITAQLAEGYNKLNSDQNPDFANYEKLMYDASDYLMTHPIDRKSKEFQAAINIIEYWKDKDTGVNIPIFGSLYKSLPEKAPHRYFYMIAMINHVLTEKLVNGRILKCVKIEGQKYSEQEDVQEVQLEGAKIFLDFAGNKSNGLILNQEAKPFFKAHKKGKLDEMFFEN